MGEYSGSHGKVLSVLIFHEISEGIVQLYPLFFLFCFLNFSPLRQPELPLTKQITFKIFQHHNRTLEKIAQWDASVIKQQTTLTCILMFHMLFLLLGVYFKDYFKCRTLTFSNVSATVNFNWHKTQSPGQETWQCEVFFCSTTFPLNRTAAQRKCIQGLKSLYHIIMHRFVSWDGFTENWNLKIREKPKPKSVNPKIIASNYSNSHKAIVNIYFYWHNQD